MLVPNSHQQQPAFRAVHSDLPDDLIEGLTVKLLPYRTNACFFGLPIRQNPIKVLDKLENILPRRWLMRDILYMQLIVMIVPIPRRQYGIQDL